MFFTLQDHSDSRTSDLLGACVDRCQDSVTTEGQVNLKESRERRAELWESARGTGRVPEDGGEVRSLAESVRESDRKIV